jgi:hypothetical protein
LPPTGQELEKRSHLRGRFSFLILNQSWGHKPAMGCYAAPPRPKLVSAFNDLLTPTPDLKSSSDFSRFASAALRPAHQELGACNTIVIALD